MKLLNVEFSIPSRHFLPLRSNVSLFILPLESQGTDIISVSLCRRVHIFDLVSCMLETQFTNETADDRTSWPVDGRSRLHQENRKNELTAVVQAGMPTKTWISSNIPCVILVCVEPNVEICVREVRGTSLTKNHTERAELNFSTQWEQQRHTTRPNQLNCSSCGI
jgi:hypothetical protein